METKNFSFDRLTYFNPTSFRLPSEIYTILEMDAIHFGFKKNNKSNISGFLNELLPALSKYKFDWHNEILGEENNDITLINKIENILNSVTLTQNSLFKQTSVTIPFRVNKKHYDDFLFIHDKQLPMLNLDFSEFIRSLLIDYTSKRLAIRERLFFYEKIKLIISSMQNKQSCRFLVEDNQVLPFVPAAIIISPYTGANIIVGINKLKKCTISVGLSSIKHITQEGYVTDFTPQEIAALQTALDKFIEKEKKLRRAD